MFSHPFRKMHFDSSITSLCLPLLVLLMMMVAATSLSAQVPEDCSNGTDDDGDTLIDCDDPDCAADAACLDCWVETQQLFGTTTNISDEFGYSVDVLGGVMIVGARYEDIPVNNSGSATIFTQEAATGVWQLTQTLTPPASCCSSDNFGSGVGISGNTAAVGAQNFNWGSSSAYRTGAVFIYERDPATDQWLEVQTLFPSPIPSSSLANADFGAAVSISGDWLVVGAPGYDTNTPSTSQNRGSVYLFERDPETGSWQQRQQFLFSLSTPSPGNENFGSTVDISGDTLVIGTPYYDATVNGAEGTASIYERDPQSNVWAESFPLSHPDQAPGDQFGFSVALSGNVVVVGSRQDDDLGSDSGSASVYERDPQSGFWQHTQQLLASTGAEGDSFGTSVAASGNVIVVGAINDDDQGIASGSAFVYHRDDQTGLWTEQQQLLPASGGESDSFGNAMSASGDVLVVGSSLDDAAGQNAGGAFVFSLDENCLVGGCGASNVEIECLSYTGSNTHAITMNVENRTPYEVDAIFVPPTVPGSSATISPNVIPLDSPLLSGESTTIELFMNDATNGQAVSFTVALMSTEASTGVLFECCSIQVDVTPPACEYCLVITDEIFVWNGADLDYTFTVSNVSGDPLLIAEHVVLASYTPGITLSNQWFTPVGGLADGDSTSFSTVIQNATANQEVCLQFSIHDALLGECCGFLRCLSLPAPLIPDNPLMIRGDANSDGTFNIADAVMTLNFLFQGTSTPCLVALDSNDDESVNVADVVFSLAALFEGSSFPASPFPECGLDPTEGSLGCVSFPVCTGSEPNGG